MMITEINTIDDIIELAVSGFTDWRQFGQVTVRRKDDLLIFNYNTMAQYEARWNFLERVSRGLIINCKTGEIVARAFDKFYGWLEGGRSSTAPIVSVMEKVDGSLAVLYRYNGAYAIATRGSFESDQANWATEFLNTNFRLIGLSEELTLLFEIIYPANRVVVNYGERHDLVLLAVRNRFTGDYLPHAEVEALAQRYGFSRPKVYTIDTLDELLSQVQTLGADDEGYVVEFADGQRFKFKSRRYLELHKLITSLTFNNILKAMQTGTVAEIIEITPDEFLHEARQWISEIESTLAAVKAECHALFDAAPKESRKEFALWSMQHHKDKQKYLFALLDGKDITPLIFQHHAWRVESEILGEVSNVE